MCGGAFRAATCRCKVIQKGVVHNERIIGIHPYTHYTHIPGSRSKTLSHIPIAQSTPTHLGPQVVDDAHAVVEVEAACLEHAAQVEAALDAGLERGAWRNGEMGGLVYTQVRT